GGDAARGLNLLDCRFAKAMRRNIECLREAALSQNNNTLVPRELALFDHPARDHQLRCDLIVCLEALVEIGEIHGQPFFLEDIGEPALRESSLKRHLAAFKTRTARIT